MKLRIIWVGKTKEKLWADAIEKYLQRLRPFADVEVLSIKEEKGKPIPEAIEREGRRILKRSSRYVLLDERGKELASEEFASMLAHRAEAEFVLGGAYGVSEEVRCGAGETVSLSRMTLTHEMARVVLLEQIYRAFMINTGRGYHH